MYYHSGRRDITVLEVAPRRAVGGIIGREQDNVIGLYFLAPISFS